MKEHPTSLPGVRLFEPTVFRDHRGFFMETYREQRYFDAGLNVRFVQDNFSRSTRGTLRGFHYQLAHPQAKLVQVLRGEVYDVAVDIRVGSPTFRHWFGVTLSEENRLQLFIPEGFAHAFVAVSDTADVAYKVSDAYARGDDYSLRWNDPELDIAWPLDGKPLLSPKDASAPLLSEATEHLPRWS